MAISAAAPPTSAGHFCLILNPTPGIIQAFVFSSKLTAVTATEDTDPG
jgi:hypothetical protein